MTLKLTNTFSSREEQDRNLKVTFIDNITYQEIKVGSTTDLSGMYDTKLENGPTLIFESVKKYGPPDEKLLFKITGTENLNRFLEVMIAIRKLQ